MLERQLAPAAHHDAVALLSDLRLRRAAVAGADGGEEPGVAPQQHQAPDGDVIGPLGRKLSHVPTLARPGALQPLRPARPAHLLQSQLQGRLWVRLLRRVTKGAWCDRHDMNRKGACCEYSAWPLG